MTVPIRKRAPYRGGCTIEGVRAAAPRTGLVLASPAAMAPVALGAAWSATNRCSVLASVASTTLALTRFGRAILCARDHGFADAAAAQPFFLLGVFVGLATAEIGFVDFDWTGKVLKPARVPSLAVGKTHPAPPSPICVPFCHPAPGRHSAFEGLATPRPARPSSSRCPCSPASL